MRFWHTEPVRDLGHRPGSFPFAIYPGCPLGKVGAEDGFTRVMLNDMMMWCFDNVAPLTLEEATFRDRDQFERFYVPGQAWSWGDRTGAFYFARESDRAKFRLFFPDDAMPPSVWINV